MMKRILLMTAAALAIASPMASAADLPTFEPAPAMVAPQPQGWDWSGAFIGVHGGYGWGDLDDSDDFAFDDPDISGGLIGAQVGYNWNWNRFVIGVEADGTFADISDSGEFDLDPGDDEIGYDWLASARGKIGFALDRFLVYGTGGAGFGGFDADFAGDGEAQFGWVAGGGVEFALTRNVTFGAEYLHYDFSDVIDEEGFDVDSSVDVARGRVNIKFNSLFGG